MTMLKNYVNGDQLFDGEDIYLNCVKVKFTPLHAHNFVEIAFVAEGEGVHKIGNKEYPCNKGEIYIINHDIPHQFIANGTSELIIYNCVFKLSFFDLSLINNKLFYEVTYSFLLSLLSNHITLKTPKATLSEHVTSRVHLLYEDMLFEYTQKEEGYIEILKAELMRLLVLILRAMKNERLDNKDFLERNQLLEKAIAYIHSNFYKDITIEALSMQAFLSQSHFCRLFKEYAGLTVKEFTQRTRINEACRLLSTTDKRIADIAFEVGYNDTKHFNCVFKKFTGVTPSNYRKDQ
jgi:AraC family transcriptional regulator, L-rhamnose operon transcriptional activator RhaR